MSSALRLSLLLAVTLACLPLTGVAQTRITYKSAKSTSSYYQMAVQIAEAIKAATDGQVLVTVEESQGSVQNVKEARRRGASYVFTSPPSLIQRALEGTEPFRADADYSDLRSLFPIPSLTMHFVMGADSGVEGFADFDGQRFLIGKGSFGARKAAEVFASLGLEERVQLLDSELNAAVPALKNGQVDGFATAGSFPAPNVVEAAAAMPIHLLSLDEGQLQQVKGTPIEIPAGTYSGVDAPTTTISLPVGAYTLAAMDEATAYAVTEAFWTRKDAMARSSGWWQGVTPELLATLAVPLHPGAQRYYQDAGIPLPDALR